MIIAVKSNLCIARRDCPPGGYTIIHFEKEGTMLTILIVDDEKLERNGIKFLLKREKEEFRILEAANGKDALGVLASNHVDILFSDIKMPYMSGLELVRQVRETDRACPSGKGNRQGYGDCHFQRI